MVLYYLERNITIRKRCGN